MKHLGTNISPGYQHGIVLWVTVHEPPLQWKGDQLLDAHGQPSPANPNVTITISGSAPAVDEVYRDGYEGCTGDPDDELEDWKSNP